MLTSKKEIRGLKKFNDVSYDTGPPPLPKENPKSVDGETQVRSGEYINVSI